MHIHFDADCKFGLEVKVLLIVKDVSNLYFSTTALIGFWRNNLLQQTLGRLILINTKMGPWPHLMKGGRAAELLHNNTLRGTFQHPPP